MHTHTYGFTLVELIVTLLILMVLTTITVPTFAGFIDNAKEKHYIAEAHGVRRSIDLYLSINNDEEIDPAILLMKFSSVSIDSHKNPLAEYLLITCTKDAYINGLTVDTEKRITLGIIYCVNGYQVEIDGEMVKVKNCR